jgi:hypothetical protein
MKVYVKIFPVATSIWRRCALCWVASWPQAYPHVILLAQRSEKDPKERKREQERKRESLTITSGCAAALTKLRKNANLSAGVGISQILRRIFAAITMTQTTMHVCARLPVLSAMVPKNSEDTTLRAFPAVGIVFIAVVL